MSRLDPHTLNEAAARLRANPEPPDGSSEVRAWFDGWRDAADMLERYCSDALAEAALKPDTDAEGWPRLSAWIRAIEDSRMPRGHVTTVGAPSLGALAIMRGDYVIDIWEDLRSPPLYSAQIRQHRAGLVLVQCESPAALTAALDALAGA